MARRCFSLKLDGVDVRVNNGGKSLSKRDLAALRGLVQAVKRLEHGAPTPMMCAHANEVPHACPCPESCYCRQDDNTCSVARGERDE